MRLNGKRCLVTGAASGLGRAIAIRFAREGASVLLGDKDEPAVVRAATELRALGSDAVAIVMDVASEASWDDVMTATGDPLRLDVLVNAAGVFARKGHPIDELSLEEWRRIQAVNLDGVFLGTRFGVRAMKAAGKGSIVNIGSIAGVAGSRGGAAYGASKGGVHTLTKQAALSCAKAGYGIRVNCIQPGYVLTSGTEPRAFAEFGSREAATAALAARNPLNVSIEGSDIAAAATYLASDEARAVTGIELVVDGGILAALWGV